MTRLVTFGDTALRFTPPGRERLETATTLELHAHGTESNVAVAASRLDVPSVWLSKLPESELGKRVVAELREHGLQTDVAWAGSDGRQGLTFLERAAAPRADVTIQDRSAVPAATTKPGDLSMGLVQGADALFVGGSTPALSKTARDTTEALFRACGGTSVFDLDYKPGLWSPDEAWETLQGVLDAVDVFVGSEDDVRSVLGRTGDPRELVHALTTENDFEAVVVTRSEHGAIAWEDGVVHEESAIETDVVDPAGQHEAFVGAFLAQLLAEAPLDRSLRYGAAAAALTRTIPGPIPAVSGDEVARLVESVEDERRQR